jgi:FkbM family methyltransferase
MFSIHSPIRQGFSRAWDLLLRSTGRHVTVVIAGKPLRLQIRCRHVDPDYEAPTTRALLNLVHPGQSVWDIGANIGIYTLLTGRQVGPTGHVAAWEPSPATYMILRDHVRANELPWCQTIQAAIGESDGGTLPLALISRSGLDPTNRLCWTTGARGITVPVGTLDAWVKRLGWAPDYVKMDIEGAEVLAFRGAKGLLAPGGPRPVIMVAVHPQFLGEFGCTGDDLVAILDQYDYIGLDAGGQECRPTQYAEYFLVPSEQVRQVSQKLQESVRQGSPCSASVEDLPTLPNNSYTRETV